jgi:hypothetical protein
MVVRMTVYIITKIALKPIVDAVFYGTAKAVP